MSILNCTIPIMPFNTSSKNLFKAAAIAQEIESLEARLQSLLEENDAAAVSVVREVSPPSQKKARAVTKLPAAKSVMPKTRSIKGLAQAVREVLLASGKPLNVAGVYNALVARKYVFSFSEPKKGLSMRMYRISGVKSLGEGMFSASKT
jgi:hypothetical protein